jgi:hypothetical protein
MPLYIYQDTKTDRFREVVQTMSEEHVYFEDDREWARVFTLPQASIDANWDCNSSADFVEKTKNKKGSMGDIWDKSRELSEERKKDRGTDSLRESKLQSYEKETGKRHPDRAKKTTKFWE